MQSTCLRLYRVQPMPRRWARSSPYSSGVAPLSSRPLVRPPVRLPARTLSHSPARPPAHSHESPARPFARLPAPLLAGPEMLQIVPDAALASPQMVGEVGAHHGPAQARPVAQGCIDLLHRRHALLDQMDRLPVERRGEAVGDVSAHLLAQPHRAHAEPGIERFGPVQHRRIAAEQLDQLDADLIVAFPIFIDTKEITDDALWKAIPAVAAGRSVVIDGDVSSAYSLGTTLAASYAIENVVPLIEKALG